MFRTAMAKFEKGDKVKLRQKIRRWITKKQLGEFSKGHEFEVLNSFPNVKFDECFEAFSEAGEILEPVFIYEVQDISNKQVIINVYEEDLKKVKEAFTDEEETEEIQEKPETSKTKLFSPSASKLKPKLSLAYSKT